MYYRTVEIKTRGQTQFCSQFYKNRFSARKGYEVDEGKRIEKEKKTETDTVFIIMIETK